MKIRTDFVTNSSSSSFILAFKNKKDAYAEICEAYLRAYREQNDGISDDEEEDVSQSSIVFDDSRCILDNLLLLMEQGKTSAEEAIEQHIESIAWYPVRHKIYTEIANDHETYPRDNWDDFKEKYGELIEERKQQKLAEIRTEMTQWLADKQYVSIVDCEDTWPESKMTDVCKQIDENNRLETK